MTGVFAEPPITLPVTAAPSRSKLSGFTGRCAPGWPPREDGQTVAEATTGLWLGLKPSNSSKRQSASCTATAKTSTSNRSSMTSNRPLLSRHCVTGEVDGKEVK
jgi:hypothetical protein